jgi:hypothetical protein
VINTLGRQRDSRIATILFVVTFVSRIPFRTKILYHWDSVNFAYALREFNVAQEQPQPPGYILYVWLTRLLDLLFDDAQMTMVWISVGVSALAVVALFYLGRAMFNRQTGLVAALFLATSPLFWFYGEIALPHSLDTLLVIVGIWWLYETMQGNTRYLYPAIIVMAIAGGVRQQTIIFLAPFILLALRGVGWKRFLAAGVLGAVICLAWFVPLISLNGGIGAYMETVGKFTERFNTTTSVFMGAGLWGVQRNLRKMVMYSLFGWGAALLPFVAYVAVRAWRREWPQDREKTLSFTLWLAPTLLFYALVHMGQQGLIFVFLPALLLWGAYGLTTLLEKAPQSAAVAVVTAALALNVGLFCFGPEYPLGGDRLRLLTRSALVNSDHYYADRFATIQEQFPVGSTAILASNWHHVEYYLPDYELLPFGVVAKWEMGEGQVKDQPDEIQSLDLQDLDLEPDAQDLVKIVLFDAELAPFNETPQLTQAVTLDHGGQLEFFALSTDQVLNYGPTFGASEP